MGIFGLTFKSELDEKLKKAKEEGDKRVKAAKEEVYRRQNSDLNNIGKGSQIKFGVPYFDVFDPRFTDIGVPVAVHGTIIYGIDDIEKFKSLNKDRDYNDAVFETNLKAQLAKYIKAVVTNAPSELNINVTQIERKILEISDVVQRLVTPQIENTFGINVRSLDISNIIINKSSKGYRELAAITSDLEKDSIVTQHALQQEKMRRMQEMNLDGQEEMQRMQIEHQRETLRIQREELQRASKLQTETNFLSAHQANLNAQVQTAQAQAHPQPQSKEVNPQMPGMPPMPGMPGIPPLPNKMPMVQYMVGINGQQAGPYNWQQLQQLVQQGQITQQTYVWKQGMEQWDFAGNIAELLPLFNQNV